MKKFAMGWLKKYEKFANWVSVKIKNIHGLVSNDKDF